nr:unnamed protein product [Digitaria exilis]
MSCFQQLWDGVQVKRSSDSFTIELLPSLGATINHSNKLQKFIISPYWELFLIVLVIYSAWVMEVQAEYFPPKEDIMLQNEGAADIYIIVSGEVTLITTVNGNEKKLKLQENLPGFMHKYETFHVPREAWLLPQPYLQYKEHRCEDTSKKVPTFGADNGSTKLVAESNQLRKPQQENSHDQSNCNCGATDGMAGKEEDHDEVHINCEARKGTEELCIQIKSEHCDTASSWHTNHETVKLASYHNTSEGITRRRNQDNNYIKASNKRVTVHAYAYNATGSLVQNGKLISLPGSLEELFEIGSQKFPGFHPTKVFSRDYAEIDDISVIRDGDHLLLQM